MMLIIKFKNLLNKTLTLCRVIIVKLTIKGTVNGWNISLEKGVRFVQSRDGVFNLTGPLWFHRYCSFHTYGYGSLKICEKTSIGPFTIIAAMEKVTIGSNCMIAEYVSIRDHEHAYERPDLPMREQGWVIKPIEIGNNVWIGAKVTVMKGCKIGDNVIIGANSVVTRDIPPNSIAVGSPARVIRELHQQQL